MAARQRNKLTAKGLASLAKKDGKHGDGGGLSLRVTGDRCRWVFSFTFNGRSCEMGLGGYPEIALAGARARRDEAEATLKGGRNPIEARKKDAQGGKPTFGQIAEEVIARKQSESRSAKHRHQWASSLRTYAKGIWSTPVDQVGVAEVLDCLNSRADPKDAEALKDEDLWTRAPETASRLRGRIEAVLDAAKAAGHRSGENPATWRGTLAHLLTRKSKLARGHHAAMDYAEVPDFMGRLRAQESLSARALEFTILIVARSGETLGAAWSEIDIDKGLWTIPAGRTKAGQEHQVPLVGRALEIVTKLSKARRSDHVFPGRKRGRPLSRMAMAMLLRRMGVEATVHGFRSSFRDWAGDETNFPREVCEAALSHTLKDKVEGAYRRKTALEKRRSLMTEWDKHCRSGIPGKQAPPIAEAA